VNSGSDQLIEIKNPAANKVTLATHDAQGYDGEKLGMAVVTDVDDYLGNSEAPDFGVGITETFLIHLKPAQEEPTEFLFYSGWELEDQQFSEKDRFTGFIKSDLLKYQDRTTIE
jgi:hypothetical protein